MFDENIFLDQAAVDQYYEDTKAIALTVDTEKDAVALLKRVKYLQYASDSFFVRNEIVDQWEDMALLYIESPASYFKNVQYDILLEEYQNFLEAADDLERAVSTGALPEDCLFDLVRDFNNSLDGTNILCRKYGVETFSKYCFKSALLQKQYDTWLFDQMVDEEIAEEEIRWAMKN